MTALTFVPAASGGWIAVASGSDLVLLEPVAAGRVDRVWETLASPGAFEQVIRLIAEDGFSALPQFALVEWIGDHVRAVVRGGVTLEVDDAEGSHLQDGRGVSTWTERGFDGVTAVRLIVADAIPIEGIAHLPLSAGAAIVVSCALAADADLDDRTVVVERSRRGQATGASTGSATGASTSSATVGGPAVGGPSNSATGDESAVSGVTLSHPLPSGSDSDDDALSGDTVFVPRTKRATPAFPPTPDSAPHVPTPYSRTPTAPVATTPVIATAPATATVSESTASVGDHDGMTIVKSAIPKGRPSRPVPTERPAPAQAVTLVLPDGQREPLDQPILIGRAPSASQVSGDKLPRLVTVGGSDQDISRTHVRFALEGDSVVVTDLHSRNGTLVVLPGKPPQKLRAGEPTTVVLDTVVDLGGGITFTVSGG